MSRRLAHSLIVGLGVVCLTVAVRGQAVEVERASQGAGTEPLTARDILTRALERAARQDASGQELDFEYLLDSTIQSLDGDGQATDTERAQYRRYPLEGYLFDELIARDGLPLDEDEAREAAEQKAEFIKEARDHAARGERFEPEEMAVRFDRELMDRYVTTLVGIEVIRDHPSWVLSFAPRDGTLPDNRRMDKALNRSTGRLWIAQEDYGLVRISFEMQRPFRYLWGLVATLRHAEGQLDLHRLDDGLWTPARFDLELDLRVLFKGIRRRITQAWTDPRSFEAR